MGKGLRQYLRAYGNALAIWGVVGAISALALFGVSWASPSRLPVWAAPAYFAAYLAVLVLVYWPMPEDDVKKISKRINELGTKSGQVLLFLSFAMASVVALKAKGESAALNNALWWWKCALLPILVGILPMKEISWNSHGWYRVIWKMRVALLWLAVLLIVLGVWSFFKA